MKITLQNFKNIISSNILTKGKNYYNNGFVIDLVELNNEFWQAKVEGSLLYNVTISGDLQKEIDYYCDCPYDWGPVCKHIAAVLFAIENKNNVSSKSTIHKTSRRKTKQERLISTIDKMSREEMNEFLCKIASQDVYIRNIILAKFEEAEGGKKGFSKLVKNALKTGMKNGFIDYFGSTKAANSIYGIIERAETKIASGRLKEAIYIYQSIIEEISKIINQADDSNGELQYCVRKSFKQLEFISKSISDSEKNDLFNYYLTESQKKYQIGDWKWELIQLAANLVETETKREEFNIFINSLDYKNEDHFSLDSFIKDKNKVLYSIVNRLDSDLEKIKFLETKTEDDYLSRELIKLYIKLLNYQEAKTICIKWIKKYEDKINSSKVPFYEFLLEIAQINQEKKQISEIAWILFIFTANIQYFILIKENENKETWKSYLDGLLLSLNEIQKEMLLAEIYIVEEMWEDLLIFIQSNNYYLVERYRKYLDLLYPKEMSAIYEEMIWLILEDITKKK